MFTQTVGYGIAVDASGNAYVTGETSSPDFPTTPGAFQSPTPMGYDAFVTKLNAQGNGLVYSVRLGGMFDDFGRGIAVDAGGRAVVTGWLMNDNLPGIDPGFPTANAFQPHYGGGFVDAFVTKLSADGSALIFSTYLGGPSFASDWGQAVAADAAGNSYVTGHTYALDFPTTPGAFQRDGAAGLNAFVTKFTPTGGVAYSTHALGGSGHDEAWGIAVDATGNAYITGNTDSWDDPSTSIDTGFPTTPGAFRRTLVGQIDAYVAKLNASGSALVYGTYLGGSSDFGGGSGIDRGFGIAVDTAGSAYVVGDTESPNFPVVNAIQTFNYWYSDAFVTKLNPSGTALEYSSYLGGELADSARGVALDPAGNVYVAGLTDSFGFPTTAGAFQAANAGGLNDHTDAFVAKIGVGVVPPPLPSLSIADVSRGEGHSGTTQLTFTISLSSASSQAVTVAYATANGTASAGSDYQAASGTLTIPAGQTTGTITVLVNGDRLGEPNESFFVNLSGATNATILDGQGVGTILDDEPRISISDVAKKEGKRGQTTLFVFTVTLSAAYDQAVTMSFRTVDGTATTSDGDYVAKTGTLTFAPGETTKTITIEVKGDSKKEANETFYLDLFGNSSNSLFVKNRGVGTILNED
jgi:Calx-beta domain/Beta-propeller repeat